MQGQKNIGAGGTNTQWWLVDAEALTCGSAELILCARRGQRGGLAIPNTDFRDRERPRRALSETTLRQYRRIAKQLQKAISDRLFVKEVTRRDMRNFLDQQEDSGVTLDALKRQLNTLKMVFNFLIEDGLLVFNPCSRFSVQVASERHLAMHESVYLRMTATMREEIEAFREAKKQAEAQDLLDLTEVIWHSGLRFVETTRLVWEDINFPASIWTIRSPKNKGGIKSIPFGEEIRPILFRRYQEGKETGPFFDQYHYFQRIWKSFRSRNPEFLSWKFHCLRHSFISRLRSQGSDAAAMILARHSTSAMSDHYTHMDTDQLRKELGGI